MDTEIKTTQEALDFLTASHNLPRVQEICGGISRQAVQSWRKLGVPIDQIDNLCDVFGFNRTLLRPDVYPPPGERITYGTKFGARKRSASHKRNHKRTRRAVRAAD